MWGIFFFFIDCLCFWSHSASPPPFQNKHSSSRAQCRDVIIIRDTVEKVNSTTRIKSSSHVLFFFSLSLSLSLLPHSCNLAKSQQSQTGDESGASRLTFPGFVKITTYTFNVVTAVIYALVDLQRRVFVLFLIQKDCAFFLSGIQDKD